MKYLLLIFLIILSTISNGQSIRFTWDIKNVNFGQSNGWWSKAWYTVKTPAAINEVSSDGIEYTLLLNQVTGDFSNLTNSVFMPGIIIDLDTRASIGVSTGKNFHNISLFNPTISSGFYNYNFSRRFIDLSYNRSFFKIRKVKFGATVGLLIHGKPNFNERNNFGLIDRRWGEYNEEDKVAVYLDNFFTSAKRTLSVKLGYSIKYKRFAFGSEVVLGVTSLSPDKTFLSKIGYYQLFNLKMDLFSLPISSIKSNSKNESKTQVKSERFKIGLNVGVGVLERMSIRAPSEVFVARTSEYGGAFGKVETSILRNTFQFGANVLRSNKRNDLMLSYSFGVLDLILPDAKKTFNSAYSTMTVSDFNFRYYRHNLSVGSYLYSYSIGREQYFKLIGLAGLIHYQATENVRQYSVLHSNFKFRQLNPFIGGGISFWKKRLSISSLLQYNLLPPNNKGEEVQFKNPISIQVGLSFNLFTL